MIPRFLPDDQLPAELLDRYLAGVCSADEAIQVEAWARTSEQRASLIVALRHSTSNVSHEGTDANTRRKSVAWERIQREFAAEGPQRKTQERRWERIGQRLAALGTVLGALILVALGVLKKNIAQHIGHSRDSAFPMLHYATRTGQYAQVTLTDGTRITLAPQTTLRVSTDFGRVTRTVLLVGEAYFDVRVAQGLPFVVRTAAISTQVLGTTFNIQRYSTDTIARIAVVSGKVLVSSSLARQRSTTISAGMAAQVTDSFMVRTGEDAAQYATWVTGRLVFREAPIEDVLTALSRWYGYQFQCADSGMAHEKVTIGLSTESSTAALATLKNTLDVELTVDGQVITLHRRHSVRGIILTRPEWHHTDHLPLTTEAGR